MTDLALEDRCRELDEGGRNVRTEVFERYYFRNEKVSPEALAREFGLKPTDVNYILSSCRERLRRRIVERVRE